MYKLTIEQKDKLSRKEYADGSKFNPRQDINGDWFISGEEIRDCVDGFAWIKELKKVKFVPKVEELPE